MSILVGSEDTPMICEVKAHKSIEFILTIKQYIDARLSTSSDTSAR